MKKLLILTNVLWLSVFVFTGFKPIQTQPKPKQSKVSSVNLNEEVPFRPVTSFPTKPKQCTTFCYDYSKEAFPGLPYNVAKDLANRYKLNHLPRFEAGMVAPDNHDSRAVWFSLETIKKFLYQIEKSTCQKQCTQTQKGNLGIRIYFGEYPANIRTSPLNGLVPQKFSGLHTLFMVPTYYDPANPTMGDVDFDPIWNVKTKYNPCAPKSIKSFADGNPQLGAYSPMIAVSGDPDPNGMQNHGSLCPPINCPGMAF